MHHIFSVFLFFFNSPELIIGKEKVDPGIVFIFEGAVKDNTYPRSRQFFYAKYFLYSGLANYKLKNYRLARSNLDIFLKIYEPASESLKYKKMARDAISEMNKLRS